MQAYTRRCDVRLITASNVDLLERVRAGAFREDLYFRLRVDHVGMRGEFGATPRPAAVAETDRWLAFAVNVEKSLAVRLPLSGFA